MGLDTKELIITESSDAKTIPSPTTWTIHSYVSDYRLAPINEYRALNPDMLPSRNTQNLDQHIRETFFQPVVDWMYLAYEKSVLEDIVMPE